jgi:lipid-binding SYLF domain-containing protein
MRFAINSSISTEENKHMKIKISKTVWLVMVLISVAMISWRVPPALADDAAKAQAIIDRAKVTFEIFMQDDEYVWMHENLNRAKGLLIFPQVLKGGFIIGGSGGTGVLLVRDSKSGEWSQPAFYTLGSVTFGLQIGGEASEIIVMVMTQKGIDSLYASSARLGGDVSVAIGPVGSGAKEDIFADFISFARSKGLYAGLNLEGSVLKVRDSLNHAYYKTEVSPVQIIVEKKVSNKNSDILRETVKKAIK